jgi:hypothetical protein
MFKFKMPIGDWSDDGHGKCDYYIVESNKDIEAIVLAYIETDKIHNISNQVCEYEEYELDQDFVDYLNTIGLDGTSYLEDTDGLSIESHSLATLVIDLMMHDDRTLELKIVPDSDMPMLNNWTAQKVKGISGGGVISLPGYGLF